MTPEALKVSRELAETLKEKPAPALKLYEIATAYEMIELALEESGGEWTPEIEAHLDALSDSLERKVENIARLIQQHTRTQEAFKAERERLETHEASHRRAAANLKAYLFTQLERIGKDRVDAGIFRVRIQKNSRPSIEWTEDPVTIPEPFRRTKHELDGTAAYDAWKAGGLPDGFDVKLGKHLRVS